MERHENNSNAVSVTANGRASVMSRMADRFGLEPGAFQQTLMATVMPDDKVTREQVAAFLVVAEQHGLNPFTKEIYAFAGKGGGVVPVVSIDGWLRLINSHPQFNGMGFEDHLEDGRLAAITCTIHRKDREHPIAVTEYMSECARQTPPWKSHPTRMLRHKVTIQGARYAFSFAGIYDEDEAERIAEAEVIEVRDTGGTGETLDDLAGAIEAENAEGSTEREATNGE